MIQSSNKLLRYFKITNTWGEAPTVFVATGLLAPWNRMNHQRGRSPRIPHPQRTQLQLQILIMTIRMQWIYMVHRSNRKILHYNIMALKLSRKWSALEGRPGAAPSGRGMRGMGRVIAQALWRRWCRGARGRCRFRGCRRARPAGCSIRRERRMRRRRLLFTESNLLESL